MEGVMAEFMEAPRQLLGGKEEKQEKSQTGYSVLQPRSEPRSSVVQARSFTVPTTLFGFLLHLYMGHKKYFISQESKTSSNVSALTGKRLGSVTNKIWLQRILYH